MAGNDLPQMPTSDPAGAITCLDEVERRVIAFFVDGVKVLGMPRSLGEIYGLLFISPSPLALDDLVRLLEISKGSASQGLRSLKSLGAVRECAAESPTGRRTYYEPAVELKRLVGGFIREQVRPHLVSGQSKIRELTDLTNGIADPERREFLTERVERIDQWISRSGKVLPLLQKILGQ